MRQLKLRLAIQFFTPFSDAAEESSSAQDILVLRLDGKLGDGVTATGFLRELKRKYSNSNLIVVTGPGTESIYQSLDFVNSVIVARKGLVSTLKLYLKLRRRQFRFIINTSHILNPSVVFLVSFLCAQKKIGFGVKTHRVFTDGISIDFQRDHITNRYKKVLNLLGIENPDMSYDLKLQAEVEDVRRGALYLVGLNSFAGGRLRNLSQATTTALVRKLLQHPDVKVVSLASDGDHRILNSWIDNSFHRRWLSFPQHASLEQNMAILSQCDLLITPDTAWVHISSALKKKLLAIYRSETNSEENNAVIWAPYGTDFSVVRSAPGSEDINTVDTDEVVRWALEALESNK